MRNHFAREGVHPAVARTRDHVVLEIDEDEDVTDVSSAHWSSGYLDPVLRLFLSGYLRAWNTILHYAAVDDPDGVADLLIAPGRDDDSASDRSGWGSDEDHEGADSDLLDFHDAVDGILEAAAVDDAASDSGGDGSLYEDAASRREGSLHAPSPPSAPSSRRSSNGWGDEARAAVAALMPAYNERLGDAAALPGTPRKLPITHEQMKAANRGDWKRWTFKLIPAAIGAAIQSKLAYAIASGTQTIQTFPTNATDAQSLLQSLHEAALQSDREIEGDDVTARWNAVGYVSASIMALTTCVVVSRYLFDGSARSTRAQAGRGALVVAAGSVTLVPMVLAPLVAPGLLLGWLVDMLAESITPGDSAPKIDVSKEDGSTSLFDAIISPGLSSAASFTMLMVGLPISNALTNASWITIPINTGMRVALDALKVPAQNGLRRWASHRDDVFYVFVDAEDDLSVPRDVWKKVKSLFVSPESDAADAGGAGADAKPQKGALRSRGNYKVAVPSASVGLIARNAVTLGAKSGNLGEAGDPRLELARVGAVVVATITFAVMNAGETYFLTGLKIRKKAAKKAAEDAVESAGAQESMAGGHEDSDDASAASSPYSRSVFPV